MLDKASAVPELVRRIQKLEHGHCLEIRTYKRDRRVVFKRTGDDLWLVLRQGFGQERFDAPSARLKKELKRLLKLEFPRSHKIRVYALGPCDEGEKAPRKRL